MSAGPTIIIGRKGSVGEVLNNINSHEVRALPLLLPPLDEQMEIAGRVEKLFAFADRVEARIEQARLSVERLSPAIVAKAFRGELVPQDPNDEPAAELLKRLAKQRSSEGKTTKSTRTKPAAAVALKREEKTTVE